ncbi:universal stress protein [Owenweeksia hongkongensis]|uniref:universal stress protein n=1 Tax=Owenweeksia hongkongensis TaxID=253245 RepID=UPI003A8E1623
MKVISALIDFTETSKKAVQYAAWIAKHEGAKVNLVHIEASKSDNQEEIENRLIDFSGIEDQNVPYTVSLGDGNYLKKIPKLLQRNQADFVVIGTHGVKGIFQTLFGANVLILVQSLGISALVVQDHTPAPPSKAKSILFPLAPHHDFNVKIDQTAYWAKSWDARVDVFCLFKGDDSLPDNIAHNLELTKTTFTKEGVRFVTTLQDSKVYSVGYSKDIIAYADDKGFDLLAIMSQNSEENQYFGNVDKTNLILNPKGIPVLCIAE